MSTPTSRAASNEASVLAGASALAPPCPIRSQVLAAASIRGQLAYLHPRGHRPMNDTETTPEPDGARPRGGAVVTGAGEGIGLQIARALAERGHAVHLTDLDAGLATRAAAELGPSAFASGLDVRSLTACRAAAARTRRRVGSLDVWVNGTLIPSDRPAWELDERARQRMLEVNLLGTI